MRLSLRKGAYAALCRAAWQEIRVRSVEKHLHERSAELQIPPLRCASVGMTKGRGALSLRVVAGQKGAEALFHPLEWACGVCVRTRTAFVARSNKVTSLFTGGTYARLSKRNACPFVMSKATEVLGSRQPVLNRRSSLGLMVKDCSRVSGDRIVIVASRSPSLYTSTPAKMCGV